MVEISIFILLVFMIIGMVFVLEMKNLLSAVVMMGAIDFGLSVIFLLLSAPDLAIVQIAVAVISLVIMIRATIHREIIETPSQESTFSSRVVMLCFLFLFFILIYPAFSLLPIFGEPIFAESASSSMKYLLEGMTQTGSPNIVTAIVLDFRAYDTLGEAIVLFTSVLGAVSVLRYRNRKKPGSST